MWTSSAPLRISLAGGGTDLPRYAHRPGGRGGGAGIDRRVHVIGRVAPGGGRTRDAAKTRNPLAREALRRHWDGTPIELESYGDAPQASGLGTSAAFCVALLAGLDPRLDDRSRLAVA